MKAIKLASELGHKGSSNIGSSLIRNRGSRLLIGLAKMTEVFAEVSARRRRRRWWRRQYKTRRKTAVMEPDFRLGGWRL